MYSSRLAIRRLGMEAARLGLAILFAASACGPAAVDAATLDPGMLPKIQAATFEVVQAKPGVDPLSYEKPLPLDLLPFQERNDKFYSIGTAFAIGDNRYVTAGHVLLAGLGSLWGPPQLRDAAGHVYAIDKVEKFSMGEDFVVFTVAGDPGKAALAPDTKPALNRVVYAVGNALGTGVVVRDGLYTSDTPEEQDGRWKWMRFSAPASPGNSGGPLLDSDGKVIGVVLMKSPNENLNYALPISEVLEAPEGHAVVDNQSVYQLDLFQTLQHGRWKADFALPLALADFYRALQASTDANSREQLKALLAKESADLFPQGDGATRMLFDQTRIYTFPTLIVRDSNGQWTRMGEAARRVSLDSNGYVDLGEVGHTALLHIRRPDQTDAAAFYRDARTRMDLLARAGVFQRVVAGEKIKITSLGKPSSEAVYTDRWQRPWLVSTWPFPHLNSQVVTYVLPVPDGCVVMLRMAPAARVQDERLDMDELASFVYATYGGTLAQWKQYLADAALPAAFQAIHLDAEYGRRFAYRSPRLTFSYTPAVQAIEPDNLLNLGFRFFLDHGQPVWDVGLIEVWKTSTDDDHDEVTVQRHAMPPAGLDADMTSHWQVVSGRQFPYSGQARYQDGAMDIGSVVSPRKASGALYTAYYSIGSSEPQSFMKNKLGLLAGGVHVIEH